MVEAGIAVNSKTLVEQFPRRSSEAIKKMRQSAEYKRVLESLSGMHGTQDGPAGGVLLLWRVHDGRVDGGDSLEAHATFGATSIPSQVTHEQFEVGVSRPQTTDSAEQ